MNECVSIQWNTFVVSVHFSSVNRIWLFVIPWTQHSGSPCPSLTPGVYSNSCPSSQWSHPAISSSVVPFSSCSQSLPASKSFLVSQLFAWGGQSTGVSALASFLPKKSQGWSPSKWIGWISFFLFIDFILCCCYCCVNILLFFCLVYF